MAKRVAGAAAVLLISTLILLANVVVAGGGTLTPDKPSFESAKLATGGTQDNTYVFTFTTQFLIKDVHVTMENGSGTPLTANEANKMTAIRVKIKNETKGSSAPNGTTGMVAGFEIRSGTQFTVEIDARSDQGNIRFNLSFSKKATASTSSLIHVPQFNGGQHVLAAWPIVHTAEGIVLPVKNVSADPLTFARFEICGAGVPDIASVTAGDFVAEIDPGGRFFILHSGSLAPNQVLEVEIELVAEATSRGAVIGFFEEN